ncbi:MAG TPA: PAS domain-containing protein, partial [Pseudomonadales bacterium]|nr:PAS domain-containing protein [Pseudomonadales bacterium]
MLEETVVSDLSITDLSLDRFLLDGFLDKIPVAIGLLDRDLRYRRVNPLLAEMNGFDPESHIGRHFSEILPALTTTLEPIFRHVLEKGVAVEKLEVVGETLDRPNEKRHWLADYHPLFDKSGQAAGIFCVVKEVTAQVRAEQAVKLSENLRSQLLDNLFSYVCLLAPDGTVQEANAAPLQAAHLDIDAVKGKKIWDCYWWNYSSDVQAQLKHAVQKAAQGETCRYDVSARMDKNQLVMLDLMLAPLRAVDGEISYI